MMIIVGHGDLGVLKGLQFSAGELWIVGSAFCWGLYTVLLRRARFGISLLPTVVVLLGAGALTALPFYLWELTGEDGSALNANGLLALAYLAGRGFHCWRAGVAGIDQAKAQRCLRRIGWTPERHRRHQTLRDLPSY